MILKTNFLEKLNTNEMLNLSKFVVAENFKHHSNSSLPKHFEKDVRLIYKEEMSYKKNSEVFVSKNYLGEILGSIRVLKWNHMDILPIQKIFGIKPKSITNEENLKSVWHIGRFAIKKDVQNITLFKQLMVCAITPICRDKKSIAFAECDSKLLRILLLLGIKATIIGKSINYLGSETIPILMTYDGLIDFYNKNIGLIPTSISFKYNKETVLPKSVVFNTQANNYSLV